MRTRAGQKAWWMVVSILTVAAAPIGAQQWMVENGIDGPDPAFRAVWGSGPDCVFAVGDRGSIWHFDGVSWSAMTSGTTQGLTGVWGSGPNDVFAVSTGGYIFHYDGSAWSGMTSGTTNVLYAVWGTGPSNVLAAGADSVIRRYDGSSWSGISSGSYATTYAIAGTSADNVFAVGSGGAILHYDGAAWSEVLHLNTMTLYGIWIADSNNIFVVGSNGTILRYDGSSWSAMTTGTTTATFRAVWGTGPNDVLAFGDGGCMYHYDGTSWTPMSGVTTQGLYGMWASGPQDIHVVGQSGTILHGNGSTWWMVNTPFSSVTTAGLQGVWGSGPNDVFAVGGGVTAHYDGDEWSLMNSPNSVQAVWGSAPNNVYAVGAGGTMLHYDGSTWSSMASGTTADLTKVWCNGPNNVFISDSSTIIRRYNGSSWVTVGGASRGLYGFPTGEVFTSGFTKNSFGIYTAILYRFNGSSFSSVGSAGAGTHLDLYAVGGSSPQDVYVVGYTSSLMGGSGIIYRYNGSSFGATGPSGMLGYRSVWASSPNDVWIGNPSAAGLMHGDGTAWTTMDVGSAQGLSSIWGSGPNDVFAVGARGTVVHYTTRTRYRLKLMVPNKSCGDVTVTPNRNYYDPNTTVTLAAEPTNGGVFVRWQGDVPTGHEQDNPLTLQMDSTKTVTALFRGPSLTLSVVHDTWGTVTVDPNQPFYRFGQWVTLTATPIEGKAFGGWTIYDPCFPGDAGHAIIDDNMVTSVQLNADTQVEAAFKCGSGLGMLPAPAALGLLGLVLLRRRHRATPR